MMNIRRKSRTSSAPLRRPETALDRRIVDLDKLQKSLLADVISLEATGERVEDRVQADLDAEAYRLLTGVAAQTVARRDLATLKRELEPVRRALDLGREMQGRERGEWLRIQTAERMDEWRELTRETAVTVLALRALNRRREEFRRALGGLASLPCMTPANGAQSLLGTGEVTGDVAYRFVQSVVNAGILTKAEAEKYAQDGADR